MNTSTQHPEPISVIQPATDLTKAQWLVKKSLTVFNSIALLAAALFLLFGIPQAGAHSSPVGCTGSGLGILLFTDAPDVHIGDTLRYSINVFNGTGVGPVVCDATEIQAFVVTPDGVSHPIALMRTTLTNGQFDFYSNVVSYVVRAQDIQPDGTVRATATDTGVIHQNDTNSQGGGNQGVNTEVSLPCLQIAAVCVGGVGENGQITFSGTVTNCGNNTLVGVTVSNFVNGVEVQVTFITNLLRGQTAPFSGFWIPTNPCAPSTAILEARGVDQFTTFPRTLTSLVSVTCSETLTPGINVTKTCPVGPVSPGQLLTFSGSVSNTGNVTLTNIVVVNNQPAPNTVVFTLASLAPNTVTNFTGSYVAPTNCSVSDTLTATAASRCGGLVSSSASATCPILTTPQIAVNVICPAVPVGSGGSLVYSGTVQNTGNITLANVVVVSDRPVPNSPVFSTASLAPGATANFTATYGVPANACDVTTTFKGTGKDICTPAVVTNIVTTTCPVSTAPAIAVTLTCPASPATTGGPITYNGTVQNTGNVLLTNVFVVNNQPAPNTAVVGPITLAPGAISNFTATFTAPANSCSVSSTVTGTGNDNCTGSPVANSASATCTLLSTPSLVLAQFCPVSPAVPGGLLTYTGTVRNAGNITITNVVIVNNLSGPAPIFTAASLAPGAVGSFTGSYIAPTNCSTTSTSTGSGRSICGVGTTGTVTSTCTILTTPQIAVTTYCPVAPIVPGGSVTYTGTVQNTGNITLTNVLVVSDRPVPNTPVFSTATLAPGASASYSATYAVPANACSLTTTFTGTGKDICTPIAVTNSATATCAGSTAPAIVVTLTCPAVPVAAGSLITYNGTVRNSGNVILTNVTVNNSQSAPSTVLTIASLAPGAISNFTASFTTLAGACTVSSTATALGNDNCSGLPVTNAASATCTLLTSPSITVSQECPPAPASIGGWLNYSGIVSNSGNITLTNVIVTENASGSSPLLWVEDALPPGASPDSEGGDSWNFVSNSPAPFSGALAHRSTIDAGMHQHFFTGASPLFVINTGDFLVAYVYLDPVNTPSEIMLQWNDGSWNHRAYWGANLISFGTNGTNSRRFIGALPAAGQWVRLEVPAALVGLEGRSLNGMAFTLYDGRATWDAAGKSSTSGAPLSGTPVFTAPTLAPGQSAIFTGSNAVPANSGCSITSTVTATGRDICSGALASVNATSICPVVGAPSIGVTLVCPVSPVATGGLITYNGTVSNTGNVTLTNVTVVNVQSSPSTVLTVASLAPGASANFTASFMSPSNACSVSSTVTASGADVCAATVVNNGASATCTLVTTPRLTVKQFCPPSPASIGGVLAYSGIVSNSGNISLTNVVVTNDRTGLSPVITIVQLDPGAVSNFTGSYTVPANAGCSITSTVTASGNDKCTSVLVTTNATQICPLIGAPNIGVTLTCPVSPATTGGPITFSGTVSNLGNVTLNNVTVVNSQTSPSNVLTVASLAPGASANFTATFTAPANACSVSSTVTARGTDACTAAVVTNIASATCTLITNPRIGVTLACPAVPVTTGGSITYNGTVSNLGNVTLNNVFVINNQPAPNTPVIGPITLAPGASQNFTASFTSPVDSCQVSSTVTASGNDACTTTPVSTNASATCTLVTAPSIVVTQNCPPGPASIGGPLLYSGSVSNSGNITLTNVVVTNDRTGTNVVYTTASLAPGSSSNYTGSYLVPANAGCSITSTVTGGGYNKCTGVRVTSTATSICPLIGAPSIGVTLVCPVVPVAPGAVITYTGTVTNSGNVRLNNVTVVNPQSSPSTVLTVASLAPGASANFTSSFTVPTNICVISSTVTASGTDACAATVVNNSASATCTLITTPSIVVVQSCPTNAVGPGGILTYSGSVSNSGNITLTNIIVVNNQRAPVTNSGPFSFGSLRTPLAPPSGTYTDRFVVGNNFSGLSYADQDKGYAATQFYSLRRETNGSSSFMTINANGTVTARFDAGTRNFDALTFAAPDVGYGPVIFYYLSHDNTGVSSFGTMQPGGVVGVVADLFVVGNNFDALTFAATDVGYGANLFYYIRHDSTGRSTFGTINPALPGTVTDRFVVGTNVDTLVFTSTDAGYGPNLFYYTRHNSSGLSTFGTISAAGTVTDRFNVGTNVNELTFTTTDAGVGPNQFYYLRGGPTITDTNATTQTVFTVASLAPGATTNFTGSYVVPATNVCTVTAVITATANNICTGATVINTITNTCPLITAPSIAVTLNCPAVPASGGGLITYTGTVSNTGNVPLNNVTVVNNQTSPSNVLTVASLAAGASSNFTATFTAPANACSVSSTVIARGADACNGAVVTNTASATCSLTTNPRIAVTLVCPAVPVVTGSPITYSGTVSNPGNVTLTNVFVVNNQPAPNTPVIGPITLAPGASQNFTTTFTSPANACFVSSTVTASGNDACSAILVSTNASATCTLLSTPNLVLTQTCPVNPAVPGGLLQYSGTVSNSGNITVTNVIVVNNLSGPLSTIVTLAPGAVSNFTGSYTAPTNCFSTSSSTASGRSICGVGTTGTVSSTCTILTTPQILVTALCPIAPIVPGGSVTYNGTVQNTGNITLTNVVVVSDRPAANTTVYTTPTLAPGAISNFTATYTVPTNVCTVATTFSGRGKDICTPVAVTNTVTATCTITTAPGIIVTLLCPAQSSSSGGPITYTGTVRNSGNVPLYNVFVVNNQPGPNTPVIGPIALIPGATSNFTATFTAPINACSVSSTVTATGRDICTDITVTNVASATCALITTPGIRVTKTCPVLPPAPGQLLTFSGSVSNSGNVTLTNIVVVNNQPAPNTTVFTLASLAPGAVSPFTGSYVTPTNCFVSDTLTAVGRSICGVSVTNTASATCPILTAPAIEVTQTCPAIPVQPGGILTYSGTVRNTGNITLTNVIVVSSRPSANTIVFTAATLAPGATANFSGSYTVPENCCVVSATLRGSGQDCTGTTVEDSVTRTCPVITSPSISVTKLCAPGILRPGDLLTYSGIVSNSGNITLINVTVVDNQPAIDTPVLGPITLAPGETAGYTASYIVPFDFCGTDTVTARGLDVCTFLPVTRIATATCPITTTPRITVAKHCPPTPTVRGGIYTFSGTVSNAGNVTLVNVYVTDSEPTNNTAVIGPITLAPGAFLNFTGSYTAPHCCCVIIDTLTARGMDFCTLSNVTATSTAVCPLLSTPDITITKICPATPVPPGGVFAYSGIVSNSGDVVLTNVYVLSSKPSLNTIVLGPFELAAGEKKSFSGSYTVAPASDPAIDTVTATGSDTCLGRTVTASANCFGPLLPLDIESVLRGGAMARVTWASTPGLTYTLQWKSNLLSSTWYDVPPPVTATSNTASTVDGLGSGTANRIYRIKGVQ